MDGLSDPGIRAAIVDLGVHVPGSRWFKSFDGL